MKLNAKKVKEIRKSGFIFLIFFGFLCSIGIFLKEPIPSFLFGALALIGFCFITVPSWSRPLYDLQMFIAQFMGKIVTVLILTITFYIVLTPTALIKRLFGGALLNLKPDDNLSSYWVPKSEPAQSRERFLKRY